MGKLEIGIVDFTLVFHTSLLNTVVSKISQHLNATKHDKNHVVHHNYK